MAAKGGHIDFMFLGPPYPAAGSDAGPVVSENVIMVDLESCPNLDLGLDLVNGYLMKDHRNFMQWKEHKMKENVFARVSLTVLDYTIWIQFWDNHRRDKR